MQAILEFATTALQLMVAGTALATVGRARRRRGGKEDDR
ncbi:hypothetical protein HDA45_006561 [Amycolatopsis umgeniensis]|uniref:Uncharacterized protein n=1 Tax=Amycolatopsis umgeniensis TaxID=336628 RepID=A0A841BD96_9PSEU|nr:hypothetical protein [Amycolatopsis umgeniensis]